jgi:hypothetical protein
VTQCASYQALGAAAVAAREDATPVYMRALLGGSNSNESALMPGTQHKE